MFVFCAGRPSLHGSGLHRRWRTSVDVQGSTETGRGHGPDYAFLHYRRRANDEAQSPLMHGQRFVVAFEGELDYRAELRGHVTVKDEHASDLQLFAAAFARYGPSCLQFIHGDFAAVVWDTERRELWACTDHTASVRLYWARVAEGLVVARELPLILSTPGVDSSGNELALACNVLGYQHPDMGCTAYRGVRVLPAGRTINLKLPGGAAAVEPWYRPPEQCEEQRPLDRHEMASATQVLEAAVATRLPDGGPVSATLSGGLDSSLVVGCAAGLLRREGRVLQSYTSVPRPGLRCSSAGDRELTDWPYVLDMAEMHPNLVVQQVFSSGRCMIDRCQQIHRTMATPVRNTANHMWLLAIAESAVREGAQTVLTGQCGNFSVSRQIRSAARGTWWADGDYRQLATAAGLKLVRGVRQWRARRALAQAMPTRHKGAQGYIDHSVMAPGELQRKLADCERNARAKSQAEPLSELLYSTSFAVEMRAFCGAQFRDPTADRKLVAALSQLPNPAFYWQGRARGFARRAGANLVPDSIRLRVRRGAQSPDEAALPQVYAERYHRIFRAYAKQLRDFVPIRRPVYDDLRQRFLAGRCHAYEAMFMHRLIDTVLFVEARASG